MDVFRWKLNVLKQETQDERNVAGRRRFNLEAMWRRMTGGGAQCRFKRRKNGTYYGRGGGTTPKQKVRCEKLGIPPAYTGVFVYGPFADLQATAIDTQVGRCITTIPRNF